MKQLLFISAVYVLSPIMSSFRSAAAEKEDSPALALYHNSSYDGAKLSRDGRVAEKDLGEYRLKNKVSSLILRKGWTLIIYDGTSFNRNRSYEVLHGSRRIRHLRDIGWNDKISSFELLPTAEWKRERNE